MKETRHSIRSKHRQPHDAIVTSLRILGLWVFENDSNSICEGLYKIYNKLVIINVCIFAIAVFTDLCFNYNDLIIFTNDGCILSGISVIIFKIFNFQLRSERIRSISEKIHAAVDVLDRSSDPGVRAEVQSYIFSEKLLLNGFWMIGGILSIALMVAPVEEGELPIRAEYPFDSKKFPMLQVAFCMQAWTVSVGLIAINSMDRMVIGLCHWINIQLVVLSANYENCAETISASTNKTSESLPATDTTIFFLPSTVSEYPRNKITSFIICNDEQARAINDSDTFLVRFKTCIKDHQRIINIIDEFNEVFSSSLFVQLFTSFSMICLAGFQTVLGANDLSSFIKFSVYLGAASFQLVCWCWAGNVLTYHSISLSTSQWLSGWEDYLTPELTSLMVVSMTQSHKSLGLQAGKFFTVSIQTFIMIIRNCYSFFAILTEMTGTDL